MKPDIILTTVTAFGAGGPWSAKHGFDGIGQVMCGSSYLTGTPEQPLRAAVAVGRLRHRVARRFRDPRRADGAPRRPDAARRSRARSCGPRSPSTTRRWSSSRSIQVDRVATVNRGQTSAPSDLFRTRDGWILALRDRQPDVRALGQAHGRGSLAHRSALQGRHRPRRQRRDHLQADGGVVRRRARPPRRSPSSRPRGFRRRRSTRRSRRSTTRTSARPVCCATRSIRASRAGSRSRRPRSTSRRRRGDSSAVRRSWASTPTRS